MASQYFWSPFLICLWLESHTSLSVTPTIGAGPVCSSFTANFSSFSAMLLPLKSLWLGIYSSANSLLSASLFEVSWPSRQISNGKALCEIYQNDFLLDTFCFIVIKKRNKMLVVSMNI